MYKQHHHFASLNFLTLIEGNSSSNCIYLPLIVYSLTRCQKLLEIASLSMGILKEITCMPSSSLLQPDMGIFYVMLHCILLSNPQ